MDEDTEVTGTATLEGEETEEEQEQEQEPKTRRRSNSKSSTSPKGGNGGNKRRGRRAGELLAQEIEFKNDGTIVVKTNSGDKTIKLARESMVMELARDSRNAARQYVESLDLPL